MAFYPISEYRPDISNLNTAYTDEIRNVIAADGSYIPMPEFNPFTNAVDDLPLGVFSARALDGSTVIFLGTSSKLYMLDNTTTDWVNVGQENINYSASNEAKWSFAAFGSYVIAVNKNDKPQVFLLGQSSKFRDLAGEPPRAGLIKVWGDFVCLMQIPDAPNRVYWSGLNDAEHWTVGEKNCDYQDFPDGGQVQGSTETTNPLIFLQAAIYKATFVPGSSIVFSFQKIQDKRGVKSSNSIACRGEFAFYADEGGFFQISSDGAIVAIGFEKVDRYVFSRTNTSDLSDICGVIDPFYSRVYWAIDYAGKGVHDELLIYDWGLQRWTVADIKAVLIAPLFMSGYTLEGLDSISLSVDDLPFSLDSKAWQGGAPVLGAISSDYKLCSFSGEPMEAIVSTPELGDTGDYVQRVNKVYAITDSSDCLVSIGARFRRNMYEPIVYASERQASSNTGAINGRSRARFHKFRIRIPAGAVWTHIKGVDVTFKTAGTR